MILRLAVCGGVLALAACSPPPPHGNQDALPAPMPVGSPPPPPHGNTDAMPAPPPPPPPHGN